MGCGCNSGGNSLIGGYRLWSKMPKMPKLFKRNKTKKGGRHRKHYGGNDDSTQSVAPQPAPAQTESQPSAPPAQQSTGFFGSIKNMFSSEKKEQNQSGGRRHRKHHNKTHKRRRSHRKRHSKTAKLFGMKLF